MSIISNVRLILKKINELNPFIGSLTGEELIPIYDPSTGKTLRLKTSEIRGGEDKTQRWLSTETYATGDIRAWNLKFWKSLVDGNLNNQPVEGAYWTEVSKSVSGNFGYWAAGVFTIDPTIVMFSDKLYWLDNTVVTIPFESVDFAAELAANKWKLITGSVGGVTTHSELTGKDDEDGFQHITSTEKTNLTAHIDGADEQKHTSNQITNTAALPNIGTDANEKVSDILGNVNARLFEQIGFSLSGFDQDVTTSSQDILKSLPYAFKAYTLRAEFATAPTGSSAIVTFYKNGVSIGTCTILATEFAGTATLNPVVSFAIGDSLSAVVTQIGTTTPGKTAKAYIQGIKYQ